MSDNKKIMIAVLLDDHKIPAWAYRSLERITQLDFVEINSVLISNTSARNSPSFIKKKINTVMGRLFDNDVMGPDYRDLMPIETLFNSVETKPFQNQADIEQLNDKNIDLLINYSNLSLSCVSPLPLGIWQHSFNAGNTNNTGYEGFWETMQRLPVIGSGLYTHKTDSSEPLALIQSYSCPDKASLYGTNNLNYWKTASFASRALEKMNQLGAEIFLDSCKNKPATEPTTLSTTHKAPSDLQYLWQFCKKFWYKLDKKFHNKKFFEQWILRFNIDPATADNVAAYQNMLPPKEVFWADPHIIVENERYYIFLEELPFATWKGYLSVIEMDKKGNYSEPVKIMEKDYHLSYPNVFKHQGIYYMIPETYDNKTIELYECIEFPHKWEFKMNLMEGKSAADTTLLFEHGRWWLFTNIQENEGASPHDELFLFYSDDDDFRTTKWIPHPLNPIISDVRTARPAGKIYRDNGKIIRPSQNCAYHYGYGVNINEITRLSETEYEEKRVRSIEPDWDDKIIATHTYNQEAGLTVMDAILDREI